MPRDHYIVNEIFRSIQGEGIRAGTVNVFVRFSHCNLKCSADDLLAGFDCDTEFSSGITHALDSLMHTIDLVDCSFDITTEKNRTRPCHRVILTGGEPSLQIDQALINELKRLNYHVAIETNGTNELPHSIDWICVSPKSAEHTLRVQDNGQLIDELKYVRHAGQGIPKPALKADHYLISPAFGDRAVSRANLEHCMNLVSENPEWRLSLQLHNLLKVR